MMEEEQLWEEKKIAAMLMAMGLGTGMGMDNLDTMMQHQEEEDRMTAEPSWLIDTTIP